MDPKLKSLYEDVFDEDGNVRACGRQKCIDLMMYLYATTGETTGDLRTGEMDVLSVRELCRKMML